MTKFQTLTNEQKYNYIVKNRKEWKDYNLFKDYNIPLLKMVLTDISILNASELKTLSSLAIHSNGELLECFTRYKNLSKQDKYSKSLLYYQSSYGELEGMHQYNLYRDKNSESVRIGVSKRTNFRETSNLCIEYWVNKGYSLDDAVQEISNRQSLNSKKYHDRMKDNDCSYSNGKQLQYYLDKGHSLIVSKELLRESQRTFSLEKCLMKYGEELGLKIYKDRQVKWQNTLNSLPNDIKDKIRDAKAVRWGKASKQSLEYFLPLYKKLRKLGISKDDLYFGITGSNEYRLKGEFGTRIYDFCILSHKIIIEFHGISFHAKTEEDSKRRNNPFGETLYTSWKNDCYKKLLAIQNGFDIIELWSDEESSNTSKVEDLLTKLRGG